MVELDANGHELRAGLRFPWVAPPAPGETLEVAPGVLWLRMPLPFGLDHINLYLLRHGDGWVAVDTGLNTEQSRAVWEAVLGGVLEGRPLLALICTHFHYDHSGLLGWLGERFRCPVYMTHAEYQALHVAPPRSDEPDWAFHQFYRQAGLAAEDSAAFLPMVRAAHFRPRVPSAFRRLREGSVLPIGDRRWQVVLGRGHSPEHACLLSAEDGLLISGDQVLPRITSTVGVNVDEPDGDPLRDWLDSLDRLAALPDGLLVLPAHERPFFGLHLRLAQLRAHHRQHLDQTLERCSEPCTAAELMVELFPRLKSRFDELMAIGETLAHTNYLVTEGLLVRETVAGVYRYRRARPQDAPAGLPSLF